MIRPFTVKVNCQIRGLASIRKELGKENTPLLVSSNSIIASEKVSGKHIAERDEGYRVKFLKVSEKLFLQTRRGSQSGRVPILPILRGLIFANPEGSYFRQSGRVPILPIRKGPILPIRRGLVFANPEGSCFCQSGRVLFLPTRRDLVFANPEGYYFCQSGGVLFLPIRRGTILLRLK